MLTQPSEEEIQSLLKEWQKDMEEAAQLLEKRERWERWERFIAGLAAGICLTVIVELVILLSKGIILW